MTRGDGIYGDISVTWSITPRDESAFLQVEGTLSIVDLQQNAVITLQVSKFNVLWKNASHLMFLKQLASGTYEIIGEVNCTRQT